LGIASRCAERNPKVSELDEIGVRCIGPSVPLPQRVWHPRTIAWIIAMSYRNLCNWARSANVLRHQQLANRLAFPTNLVKSIGKITVNAAKVRL
jgi:hypothetical protein